MVKFLLRRVAAALGLGALLVGAPLQAKAPSEVRPALWKVSDPDTTIYLFGTIHLLPENFQWQSPKFQQAVDGSQELLVETIVDPEHPQDFASAFAQLALSQTPAQLGNVKTWAVGFQLLSLQFAQLGLLGKEGPETILRREFTAAHKPVDQLETIRDQLGIFDTLSEKAQREFLEGTIENPADMKKVFGSMLSAWASGDVNTVAKVFNSDFSGSPELRQRLLERRNDNWARWIEKRLAQPGTIMVAVGAGHLAGEDSVISTLQKDGYRVQRVQ
jgi:hypothetical protein